MRFSVPGHDDFYIEKVESCHYWAVNDMYYDMDGWVNITKPVADYNDCCDSDEIEVWEFGIPEIEAHCACYRNADGTRKLVCLIERASFALTLGTNDSCRLHDDDLAVFLVKEAMDAGFPSQLPKCLSWRDIRNQLNAIEDETVLDMDAGVWLYNDCEYDFGFNRIIDLRPYDASEDAGKENELSFDIRNSNDLED